MKITLHRFDGKKGFTLIELLVVIAIIALLSSVVMSSVSSSRVKSRDAKRMADLYQIRTALSLYFDDNHHYPTTGNAWYCSNNVPNWNAHHTALSPYMSSLPKDPRNTAGYPWVTGQYAYCYGWGISLSTDYDLTTQFEDTSNQNRCQLKGWLYHRPESPVSTDKNRPWCTGFTNSWAYSPYLYSDH